MTFSFLMLKSGEAMSQSLQAKFCHIKMLTFADVKVCHNKMHALADVKVSLGIAILLHAMVCDDNAKHSLMLNFAEALL